VTDFSYQVAPNAEIGQMAILFVLVLAMAMLS
jgi:hypothetical protein